jgi:hypothetical protein
MMTADSVVVSTIVAVDRHTAFSIFTEEMEAWWKPKVRHLFQKDRPGVMKFEPGPYGRLVEVYDDGPESLFEVGRVRTWTPGERLVFEWLCVDITRSVIQNQQLTFASVVRDLTLAVGVTTVGP